MKRVKRSAWGVAVFAAAVLTAAVALLLVVGGVGESRVEAWAGEQIKAAVAQQLKPTLAFDSIDYQAPLTLVLGSAKLTAADPDLPGETVDIISCGQMTLVLAELPRQGKPLKLASVAFDGAEVRLVNSASGGLVGFSDMMRQEHAEQADATLSDVLQITELTIRHSAIEYDSRAPGTEPMRFEGIDTTLDIDPSATGAYGIDLGMTRADRTAITLVGSLDLDNMQIAVDALKLATELDQDRMQDLPPQAQAFVKRHGLKGRLEIDANGTLDLDQPARSQAKLGLSLNEGHGQIGGYRLPIKSLEIDAVMADRIVRIDELFGEVLGGQIDGAGQIALDDAMPMALEISGNGLMLQSLYAAEPEGSVQAPASAKEPFFATPSRGIIDLQVKARAPASDVLNRLSGGGEVRLSKGRIAGLPLVSSLIAFMESQGDLDRLEADGAGTDTGQAVFELRGDHAYLSTFEVDASWYAMRGRGKLYADGGVAMKINAGPLQKVQNTLGLIGRPLGVLTDALLAYRVSGSFGALKIRPLPLGGIIGAPGDDESAPDE